MALNTDTLKCNHLTPLGLKGYYKQSLAVLVHFFIVSPVCLCLFIYHVISVCLHMFARY